MLKKLRLKFVCINMALLTVMLCVMLGLVVHFTRASLEAEALRMMQSAAARPPDFGRPGGFPPLCFTVQIGRAGQLLISGGYGVSSEEARALVEKALSSGKPDGVLEDYGLRFLNAGGPELRLVFADVSRERAALAHLTRICAAAGCAGFGALLLLSFFLAKWAVKPVERAWEQQRQFVADASHELKTPLTVILTNAELLQGQGNAGPEAGHILAMSRQMRGLVENLLDLARIDGGAAQKSELDLSRLILDTALPFEAVLFERGLTLTEQVEEGVIVNGCAPQLRQAVEIFLDNAQKYAAPGTVELRLRREGRNRCVLSLSSPGAPIPPEELENIFKRFYRLDKARSRDGSCGLGLSIARGVAAAHRGRTWAEGGADGNTFFLELPVL